MKEGLDKDISKKENSLTKENRDHTVENGKKKSREGKPATKVVVRRLPPTMTLDLFMDQVSPLPPVDYMYFVQADMSLTPHSYSRAYIHFSNQEDLFIFTEKFDNYVFVDSKGQEYTAVVEFAPFQRIPKHRPNRKKDPKMGTIESDPAFIGFKNKLETEKLENKLAISAVKQHFFETPAETTEEKEVGTPLLDYIRLRRAERQRFREEKREEKRKKDLERRRAKDEYKKTKKDEDSSALKVLNSPVAKKDGSKERDSSKSSVSKKRTEEGKSPKEKGTSELRSRDKNRIGKSYQEERQRQAERREELRKKTSSLSRSQSRLSDSKTSLNELKDEIDKNKSSHSEEKALEQKPIPERRLRDSERRKTDRSYRKEEGRRSTRSEGRRDVEENTRRKSGRISSYSKKDDDRKDDYAGKRRSEIKRNSEYSNLDRNKEHIKGRLTVKKNSVAAINTEKENEKQNKEQNDDLHDNKSGIENDKVNDSFDNSGVMSSESDNNENNIKVESSNNYKEITPRRRNSLESGIKNNKNLCSIDCNSEHEIKRRRNSCDSHSDFQGEIGFNTLIKVKKEIEPQNTITEQNDSKEVPNQNTGDEVVTEEKKTDDQKLQYFESNEAGVPKRRKSMEERRGECSKELSNCDKENLNRRNSLESGDQRQNSERLEKIKINESENKKSESGNQKQNKDPRTVRRIRNKDRPTLEIYRPGMGRFSKQRLERGKVLGSSTEVETPSSSPSPTPVPKPKAREH